MRISLIAAIFCFGFQTQAMSEQSSNGDILPIIVETADGGPDWIAAFCAMFANALSTEPSNDKKLYKSLTIGFAEIAVNHGNFPELQKAEALEASLHFLGSLDAEEIEEMTLDLNDDEDASEWQNCLEFAAQYPETLDLIK